MTVLEIKAARFDISQKMGEKLKSTDPAAKAEWQVLRDTHDALYARQMALEKQEEIDRELSGVRKRSDEGPRLGNEGELGGGGELSARDQNRATQEYRKAFLHLCRTGKENYETRALSSSGDGSTLIPLGFERELEIKLKDYSGMRQACRILHTDQGNNITWPTVDDTSDIGAIIAESAGVTTADPTFSSVTLGSSLISSKQVIVPIQVLQDSAIDLEQYLGEAFSIRIGRAMEAAYTTGAASITGLITALVTATGRNVQALGAKGNSNNVGDTPLNSIGTVDLGNLTAALDPAYVKKSSFMAGASVWNKLRAQLDAYGRPIWQVSVASGEPDKVWGRPFYYNQNMAGIGAGNISMILGDFSKYLIRDSLGFTMAVQRELYITNHQIGFLAFCRTDGKLLQPSAFVYLQHPLS
jgi:HK97 family phage major capsid protein